MTKVEFDLPDLLAQRAAKAGLLAPERFEAWLNFQLKGEGLGRLRTLMARADDGILGSSPEQLASDIRSMRAEKRHLRP